MRIVSPLLKRVVYPALSITGVFHRISASGLAVVTYHGLIPPGYEPVEAAFDGNLVSADMLRRQLRLLKDHYQVVSPGDVLDWLQQGSKLPERAVLVTCDDGLVNCLTDMLPVLQEEQVKCLFFMTGSSAGESRTMLWYEELFLLLHRAPAGRFEISSEGIAVQAVLGSAVQRRALWWDLVKKLSQWAAPARAAFVDALRAQVGFDPRQGLDDTGSVSCRRFGLMTCGELRELAAAGMSIGAHTMSHPMLSKMPADLALAEISESRMKLESALHQRVWAFAYPFGDPESITPQVLPMAEKAGYEMAFVNFGGGLGTRLPVFAMPRIHITAEMNLPELDAHVSGFYARLQRHGRRDSGHFEMMQGAALQ